VVLASFSWKTPRARGDQTLFSHLFLSCLVLLYLRFSLLRFPISVSLVRGPDLESAAG